MRADEFDVDRLVLIGDCHHEAVVIAFDVEDDAIVRHETGRRIVIPDVLRRTPLSVLRLVVPGFERLLRCRVLGPESLKYRLCQDSHLRSLVPFWDSGKQASRQAKPLLTKNAPDPSIRGVLVFHGAEGGTRKQMRHFFQAIDCTGKKWGCGAELAQLNGTRFQYAATCSGSQQPARP